MKPDKDKPKSAPKKPNGRVFDVSRPGKTPASPTSRPVIMGHKPEAQEAQAAVSGVGENRPLLTKRKIEITPFDESNVDSQKPSEESIPYERPPKRLLLQATDEETNALAVTALDAAVGPPPVDEKPDDNHVETRNIQSMSEPNPAAQKPEPKPKTEPKLEESKPEEPTVEPKLAANELPAETSSMPEIEPAESALPKEEETVPEPVIEPLFDDSGAIVVSNHDHHHRHHGLKVLGLILLILILAVVGLDIVLDLGLIDLKGFPHTNSL